ncbi:GspE/PulE family protein [Clostridium ganghwense]|uniref:GspE/PulE family protein n=1 Tax=Clostridium ganghwense TaxID=312089 RepID=A0ABT4CQH5_9CLOT|nr:GspE/PulE family protein [Clostridium ganghwense]MCY6370336.1 GspE/PulE family protein [Clostridium ganghwense]
MRDILGNTLLKEKVIAIDDYNKVLKIQRKTKAELVEILLNNNYVKKSVLYKIFKKNFHIESVELDNLDIPTDVVKLLPKEISKKYNVIPFGVKNEKICVAMTNPLNAMVIDDIRFLTNKDIIPYIERKNKIIYAIESYYDKEFASAALKDLKSEGIEKLKNETIKNQLVKNEIDKSPIVRITNSIIYGAISEKASDIHLEPFENEVNIRYRIDGVLKGKNKIPKEVYPAICTRLKIMSSMDISKKLIPQDGKMQLKIDNKKLDFRVSTIPTVYGEKIAIRILYKEDSNISLKSLKLNNDEYALLRKILETSNGIVLATGPTGCGKSTTLYTLINEINSEEKNIITIEDPVEYTIKGVNQVNVNYKSGLDFAAGLRSVLRQDPDIIMVGEIRDEETAQIAVKAAITGHLVFSTLHTNSAPSAIERLINMNVPNYLTADALVAVIAQRLIREICPYCKEKYIPKEEELKILGVSNCHELFRGRGCIKCNNTGYKGRRAIFEIMYLNSNHKKLICQNKSIEELREYSIKEGMSTLNNSCKTLVLKGITTVQEMMKGAYENL